jgi:carbonic anhydrase
LKAIDVHRKEKEPRGFTLSTTPADFIPPIAPGKRHRAYRYQGSLTTAPYTEPVAWIVFRDFLPVSRDLITYLDPPGPDEPQHARAVQPLNGRLVLDITVSVDRT